MRLAALALFVALGTIPATAQYVSLHGGASQWFFAEPASGVLALEAGLPLSRLGSEGAVTVEGALRFGVSGRNGSAPAEPCASCVYDRRNAFGGALVGVRLNRAWLPLRLGLGLTAHHETIHAQEAIYSTRSAFVTADVDLRVGVPLAASLILEAGATGSTPLSGQRSAGPTALTLGLRWQR